jgi:tetratricopeptide (TPR) repeat protein
MIIEAMEIYEEFLRGMEAFRSGDYEKAIFYLRRVKRKEPSKISIRETLGRAYFKVKKFRKALYEFEFIINTRPDNDYAYFCAGLCLLKLGKKEEGLEKMRIAIALNPQAVEYRDIFTRYFDQV